MKLLLYATIFLSAFQSLLGLESDRLVQCSEGSRLFYLVNEADHSLRPVHSKIVRQHRKHHNGTILSEVINCGSWALGDSVLPSGQLLECVGSSYDTIYVHHKDVIYPIKKREESLKVSMKKATESKQAMKKAASASSSPDSEMPTVSFGETTTEKRGDIEKKLIKRLEEKMKAKQEQISSMSSPQKREMLQITSNDDFDHDGPITDEADEISDDPQQGQKSSSVKNKKRSELKKKLKQKIKKALVNNKQRKEKSSGSDSNASVDITDKHDAKRHRSSSNNRTKLSSHGDTRNSQKKGNGLPTQENGNLRRRPQPLDEITSPITASPSSRGNNVGPLLEFHRNILKLSLSQSEKHIIGHSMNSKHHRHHDEQFNGTTSRMLEEKSTSPENSEQTDTISAQPEQQRRSKNKVMAKKKFIQKAKSKKVTQADCRNFQIEHLDTKALKLKLAAATSPVAEQSNKKGMWGWYYNDDGGWYDDNAGGWYYDDDDWGWFDDDDGGVWYDDDRYNDDGGLYDDDDFWGSDDGDDWWGVDDDANYYGDDGSFVDDDFWNWDDDDWGEWDDDWASTSWDDDFWSWANDDDTNDDGEFWDNDDWGNWFSSNDENKNDESFVDWLINDNDKTVTEGIEIFVQQYGFDIAMAMLFPEGAVAETIFKEVVNDLLGDVVDEVCHTCANVINTVSSIQSAAKFALKGFSAVSKWFSSSNRKLVAGYSYSVSFAIEAPISTAGANAAYYINQAIVHGLSNGTMAKKIYNVTKTLNNTDLGGVKVHPTYLASPYSVVSLSQVAPTAAPTVVPSLVPTTEPTFMPSLRPSVEPSPVPTIYPSQYPTVARRRSPSPTKVPTLIPSQNPTITLSALPSLTPTMVPTVNPTTPPSIIVTPYPSAVSTKAPSIVPSMAPTAEPTLIPIIVTPTFSPPPSPTMVPTLLPTPLTPPTVLLQTLIPSRNPTISLSVLPSLTPTMVPTANPTSIIVTPYPSAVSTKAPSVLPTMVPTAEPTLIPIVVTPTISPTNLRTDRPTLYLTHSPTMVLTLPPNSLTPPTVLVYPSIEPSVLPNKVFSSPSSTPSNSPTEQTTTMSPVLIISDEPSHAPSTEPTASPTDNLLMEGDSISEAASAKKKSIIIGATTGVIGFCLFMACIIFVALKCRKEPQAKSSAGDPDNWKFYDIHATKNDFSHESNNSRTITTLKTDAYI